MTTTYHLPWPDQIIYLMVVWCTIHGVRQVGRAQGVQDEGKTDNSKWNYSFGYFSVELREPESEPEFGVDILGTREKIVQATQPIPGRSKPDRKSKWGWEKV